MVNRRMAPFSPPNRSSDCKCFDRSVLPEVPLVRLGAVLSSTLRLGPTDLGLRY